MAQPAKIREALLQAVDEGLFVPGQIVRAAIYERLESSYLIRRAEIPDKLEAFHAAMEDLLGEAARVMERLIAKNFHANLKLNFTQRDHWTLVDYVNHVRRSQVNASRHEQQ
jgi:hypothetical protein